MRDETVCMMRIRNEQRWIRRSLLRTFEVARTVVLWDDHSEDETWKEAKSAIEQFHNDTNMYNLTVGEMWGWQCEGSKASLHFINSPFRPAVRAKQNVSEIRDKNTLWEYVKSRVDFKYVLCLDGDEMLSKKAVRFWPSAINAMDGGLDVLVIPFIYLWNDEKTRRVDGLYGNEPDNHPRLRFPRAFTIMRQDEQQLFDQRFKWEGSGGGFHCGSVPNESFKPLLRDPQRGMFPAPMIHFGYMHAVDRQKKYEFYNIIDPGNDFEGEYKHMVELPNRWCPGPTQLEPYTDE